jgi:lipopolysaccharide transport protein LptA
MSARLLFALTACLVLTILNGARPVSAEPPQSNGAGLAGLKGQRGQEPVDISSDEAHVSEANRVVVLTGHVLARQGEVQLQADTVTVHYLASGQTGDSSKVKIDSLEAQGNVVVTRPGEVVKSMAATYKMIEKQILMHGNVVATRGTSVVRGNNLIVDLVKETIKLQGDSADGRVHAIFTPPTNGSTQ